MSKNYRMIIMLVFTLLVNGTNTAVHGRATDSPFRVTQEDQLLWLQAETDKSKVIQEFMVRTKHNGSGDVVLVRLLDIHTTEHKRERSFNRFINQFTHMAFQKNKWRFPIEDVEEIRDPKTNLIPTILVSGGTDKKDISRDDRARIEVLPEPILDIDGVHRVVSKEVEPNSLIMLPKPYVIAGSFHREMYPHDTSSVLWAILELANIGKLNHQKDYLRTTKDQLENFAYQVNKFGFPLNGNRGYYLTRSQTNIIPTNVLQYYLVTKDKEWLRTEGLPMAKNIFDYWTVGKAKVSTSSGEGYRWIQHGDGPCLEVMESHKEHHFYYFKVLQTLVDYLNTADLKRPSYAKGFDYNPVVETISKNKIDDYLRNKKLTKQNIDDLDSGVGAYLLDKSASEFNQDEPVLKIGNSFFKLTKFYYKNDRASRVSGYDTNHLYGPFNSFTYDFIPADHNLLLYKQAKDIAEMEDSLGNVTSASEYRKKADALKEMIMKILWDKNSNMFFEYDAKNTKLRTEYPFLSSAYALWAGIFDITKADEKLKMLKVVRYLEDNFEGPTGFFASTIETGLHWDKPYTWPVQQQYIVFGLREYAKKLNESGDEVASKYLTNIADRISIKYLLANYSDWLSSGRMAIGEKVLLVKQEDLLTGYESGSNYTWNLAAVNYLYEALSDRARRAFDSLID